MADNSYSKLSQKEFFQFKKELEYVINKSLSFFKGKLAVLKRVDDSEHLNINFKIIDDLFENNIAFLFNDESSLFSLVLIKTLDQNKHRFFLKQKMKDNLPLQVIVDRHNELIQECLDVYFSWSKENVLSGERIKLD